MTVAFQVRVTVHCNGGWHQPLEFYAASSSKTDINAMIRQIGWVTKGDKHYCQEHKP